MKKWQNDVEFHEELRQCSISAYNPYEKGIPSGYKLVAVSKVDPSTGFAAIALQKGDEIVIAFRGTELDKDDNIDFKNDIKMMLKNFPQQYIDKVFKKNSPIFEHYEKPKTYRWETNKGACTACQKLDNKEFESKEDIPEKPHPNCKCKVKVV